MKKLNLFKFCGLTLFMAAMIMFSSCSSTPESTKLIPKETMFVLDIDVPSIGKKANMKELENLKMYQFVMREMKSESVELSRFVDDLKSDPKMTGLNLNSDVFLFAMKGIGDPFFCVSAEMKDKAKFETFLGDIFRQTEAPFSIKNESDLSIGYVDTKPFIAWDKSKVLLVIDTRWGRDDETVYLMKDLFSLKSDRQITSNDTFKSFYNNKKDISFWMSYSFFNELDEYKTVMRALPFDFSNTSIEYHLSFEKDKIAATGKVTMDKKTQDAMNKYDLYNKMNGDLLKYIPKNTYALMSSSMNIENIFEFANELFPMKAMLAMASSELGFEMLDIFTTINGNFIFSLHGLEEKEVDTLKWDYESGELVETTRLQTVPMISFVADLNGCKLIDDLMAHEAAKEILKKENDYYLFSEADFNIYFAYNEKLALITTDENVVAGFKNGGLSENLNSSPLAGSIKKYVAYGYGNLNYADYPEYIRNMLEEETNSPEQIKIVDEFLNNIEYTATKDNKMEFAINVDNKSGHNSLFGLFQMIDRLVMNQLMDYEN